jgi:hypothetical protein
MSLSSALIVLFGSFFLGFAGLSCEFTLGVGGTSPSADAGEGPGPLPLCGVFPCPLLGNEVPPPPPPLIGGCVPFPFCCAAAPAIARAAKIVRIAGGTNARKVLREGWWLMFISVCTPCCGWRLTAGCYRLTPSRLPILYDKFPPPMDRFNFDAWHSHRRHPAAGNHSCPSS